MPVPVLLSVAEVRPLLSGDAATAAPQELELFLLATDEVVAGIVGPLTGPIPARWRLAARIIAEHLWDHWQGAVPDSFQGGTDLEAGFSGFAIPRAARELLVVPSQLAARAPVFSFPAPALWPGL